MADTSWEGCDGHGHAPHKCTHLVNVARILQHEGRGGRAQKGRWGAKREKNKATSVDGKGGEYLPGDCNLHLSVCVCVCVSQFRPHDILQR